MQMQQISGYLTIEVHNKLKSHPLRSDKTLAEFYQYIFEKFLDSPESKLAEKATELEHERIERECWKQLAQRLEAENRELKSGGPAPAVPVALAPAARPAPVLPPDDPEGDFVAVIRNAAADESPSRSAVDVTLAAADGRTFVDRVVDFPPSPRTAHFKKALGLGAADSVIRHVARVIGKSVLVRRTKNHDASGPRMLTYYHPVPTSVDH